MANFYVRLENGAACEIFPDVVIIDGTAYPIAERFHPDFLVGLIPVNVAPNLGDVHAGNGIFSAPLPPEVLPPTESENRAMQARLMANATQTIEILSGAVELEIGEPGDAEKLLAWKKYRVLLSRVDLLAPTWPTEPEA